MANVYFLVTVCLIIFCLWRYFSDPLRSIPGPLLARFTRLWEANRGRLGHLELDTIRLHQKYGPVVRLAPGRYSFNDPSAVRVLYGHGSKLPKTDYYSSFQEPGSPNIFSQRDIPAHSDMRRKAASLYSVTSLVTYESFVDRCTSQFCQILGDFADAGESLPVPTWLQYYAFDVIGEITVGRPFGMMDKRSDHQGILANIDMQTWYSMLVGVTAPWLHNVVPPLLSGLGAPDPLASLISFMRNEIAAREREGPQNDRQDFLAKTMQLRAQGKMNKLEQESTIGSNIGAGSDTTAVSLSSVVYYLMQVPDCLKKLQQELDMASAEGRISDPITYKEAQQLPYLQAVIKEALRVHPATGLIHAREVPAGGAMIGDTFFPAGSHVGVNPWALHYNPKAFGKDAEQFRPERWLVPKEEASVLDQNLLSFGLGDRTCIGKNISLLEMSKLLPQVYRQYEFVPLTGDAGKWETANNWFVKPSFSAKIRRRAT